LRQPVTSFVRFHISLLARRKGEGSILVNPFTSIGYVECKIASYYDFH